MINSRLLTLVLSELAAKLYLHYLLHYNEILV